ncbi:NF038120 family PEP-CTERM protein [Massilia sp. PAMC28688]|uniref:NF038120 family PEP-CTERM protein n=1 Tax=Massilia sp. PAMC28688 TaxID=2861283 RepID=UPI001C624A74|nr:NF038120 family PEP-CTERM protein [Massilia sp. PAMC28688]QYF92679.1 NF038120 family PEP-CTERM protein [Massilia sp. PAMC28688]
MNRQSKPAAAFLKNLLCASVLGACGVLAAPAQAALLTFDAAQNVVTPVLNAGDTAYNTGDAFTEGLFTLQVLNNPTAAADEYGAVGAMIDSDNAMACTLTACPVGNGSVYFGGLNDGWLNITIAGAAGFRVAGLDYAFIAPLAGLQDFSYGRLMLTGTTADGSIITTGADFPGQNLDGRFVFDAFMVDSAFRSTTLTSLAIGACLFDGNGDCVFERELVQNQAQFAIDDLNLNVIPEPSSYALMLLGIAGLAAFSRRRA